MQLTPNQQRAAFVLDRSLAVTAGAGSGKTRVLVKRFVHILEHREADLSGLVAITFTNKAAQEMKERVRQEVAARLDQAVRSGDERGIKYWQQISASIESARISTIHSLGLQILRENPVEAEIDPGSQLLDEVQGQVILNDIATSCLLQAAETTPDLQALIDDYGVRQVTAILIQLYTAARASGLSWQTVLSRTKGRIDAAKAQLADSISELKQTAADITAVCRQRGGSSKFVARWLDPEIMPRLCQLDTVSDIRTREYAELKAFLKELCGGTAIKEARDLKADLKEGMANWQKALGELDAVRVAEAICTLLEQIDDEHKRAKRAKRWLDYIDLEVGLVNLLENHQDIRMKYQQQFKHVLVDEFQDTNPLQQRIIQLLSPPSQKGLFVVGDIKQSIYRFRGAEAAGFNDLISQLEQSGGEVIALQQNFRSDRVLIDFFNDFFGQVFGADSSLKYQTALHARSCYGDSSRVELLVPPYQEGLSSEQARRCEAAVIAERITELCGSLPVIDGEQERTADYGDFALLFRATTDIKIYERELRRRGIPYVVVGGRGFFKRQEISDCLNLLHYLHDRSNLQALAGILRSPLFALSDEALYWLARTSSLADLTDCSSLSEADRQLWNTARALLRDWSKAAGIAAPSQLLRRCLDEVNYQAVLLGVPGCGIQAWANVEQLVSIIQHLEEQGLTSLTEVLDYLAVLAQDEKAVSEAPISFEGDNTVKLMSIHQSKGLQFPVVIVPDCGRSPNLRPRSLAFDPDYGIIYRGRDYDGDCPTTLTYEQYKQREVELEMSEYRRVLYVAATRASDYLIFSVGPDKLNPALQEGDWLDWLAYYLNLTEWPVESQLAAGGVTITVKTPGAAAVHGPGEQQVEMADSSAVSLLEPLLGGRPGSVRIAATALREFMQCPRLFFYRYWYRLPEPRSEGSSGASKAAVDPLMLGSIVHSVCELLTDAGEVEQLLEQALNLQELKADAASSYRKQALPMLKAYADSDLLALISSARTVKSELPIGLWLQEFELTGIIDKYLELEDGAIAVVDFKTDSVTAAEVEAAAVHHLPQLAVYALAVHRRTGRLPQHLWVYFLRPGVAYDLANHIADAGYLESLITDQLDRLRRCIEQNSWPRSESCSWCGYAKICTEKLIWEG